MPNDFFYCMNKGSGKNLNWFWVKWFFEDGIPDMAINSVKINGSKVRVIVDLKGDKPVPIDITVYYTDGTTDKVHRSISVWENERRVAIISFNATHLVSKIVLGHPHTPDSNNKDNTWLAK
jgi:hypothetical protein